MFICKNLNNIYLSNVAIAIGLFDGVHVGHMKLINELQKSKLATCIFSFDISNRKPALKQNAERIISFEKKCELLSKANISYFIEIPFEQVELMYAEDFIEEIIVKKLGCRLLVCGKDFKFGYKRLGDIDDTRCILNNYGSDILVVEDAFVNNEKVSSSKIREYIRTGNISKANALLGRNFTLDFDVVNYSFNDGVILQMVEDELVFPPSGEYNSVIKFAEKTIKTKTNIYNSSDYKLAITCCEKYDVTKWLKNIVIELI